MSADTSISVKQLPDWMRRAQRGIDWGALLAIALSLIAAWPFILYPGLPHTNASENYVYQVADYATALQEGRLYPRWASHALSGYGAPIPNYYPPGAPYAAALIQVLFTDDPVLAVRLIYILALTAAGTAVYTLVMRHSGASSGILAAFLYIYSPYTGLVAPHILGDLPGVVALALMPLLLWSTDRLLHQQHPNDMPITVLVTAALWLTDIRTACISLALAGLMLICHQRAQKSLPWTQVSASYLLGLGLSGFYWIPAWLEQDAVHWRAPLSHVTPTLCLAALLSPLQQIDPGELVPAPQWTLGLAGIVFTLLGGFSVIRFKPRLRLPTLFLISGAAFILAALVFPSETWLLGPIMLCLAVGGSATLQLGSRLTPIRRRLLLPILLILIWIMNHPVWLAPLNRESFGPTDALTQIQYEQLGYGIAALPPHQFAPVTLSETVTPSRLLTESYFSDAVNKIALGQLTPNLQVGILEHDTHSDHFQVRASTPTTLNILTAYFPGWQATLDNQLTSLLRNPETGLIQVDVPITRGSELLVTLGSTPVRTGAWIIAWVALFITVLLTRRRLRHRQGGFEDFSLLSEAETRLLMVLAACLALLMPLFSLSLLPVSLRAHPGYQLADSISLQARTDGGLSLLSYQLDSSQHQPGDSFEVSLYWQAQRFLSENYRVLFYLLNLRDGSRWNETILRHPDDYPTRRWSPNRYVRDTYPLILARNMPPGEYAITVEVYGCNPECSPSTRLTFFNSSGRIIGPVITLPTTLQLGG